MDLPDARRGASGGRDMRCSSLWLGQCSATAHAPPDLALRARRSSVCRSLAAPCLRAVLGGAEVEAMLGNGRYRRGVY